jgi:hypothetical protein
MTLTSPHKLSPSLVLAGLALAVASSGPAIVGGRGSGDPRIAKADAVSAVGVDLDRTAGATGKPRRADGSLLPRLGR